MRLFLLLLFNLLFFLLPAQDLSVFELFTDHAVLQRDASHPVWGWAKPGRRITVSLDDQRLTARTDRNGQWSVELPASPAGGPHTLTVSDGRDEIRLQDIYFGDVYLLSGQSNMEWRLAQSDPDSTRARAIADALIRQVLVAKTSDDQPRNHLALEERWKPGTPGEMADFSGVGAYFAHYLREAGIEVPIGLLHSSWGGSRIEAWLPAGSLNADSRARQAAKRAERDRDAQRGLDAYREAFGTTPPPDRDSGQSDGYLAEQSDLTEWATMKVPGAWEERGYPDVDGVFYFRRTFHLTSEQASGAAILHLGPIDDGDLTYVNGVEVGATPNAYSQPRKYTLTAGNLRSGPNVLAVRVQDTGGGGGFTGPADSLYLETANGHRIALAGDFHYRIGSFRLADARANHTPSLLYNAMIAPLRDWPLTAVLWYQGESNAGPEDAPRYADQMRDLIRAWRAQIDQPDLPFYWVQLANYQPATDSPDAPGWAIIRAQQTAALDVPATGQAVITDLGEADDIHPKNKWEVGRRLSLLALRNIYNMDIPARSPTASRLEVHDRYSVVHLTDTGDGLVLRPAPGQTHPYVGSLAVQTIDGQWMWAVGTLDARNGVIVVLHPDGMPVQRVRYGWSDNPPNANIFTKDGLPVTPFEIGPE